MQEQDDIAEGELPSPKTRNENEQRTMKEISMRMVALYEKEISSLGGGNENGDENGEWGRQGRPRSCPVGAGRGEV